MNINSLLHGDCNTVLREMPEFSVDTIITDPPYGYSFMNKDWDKAVVPVDTWKECLRVLKPGAFTAIMSSPRQDVLARMICNLQDAGFRTDFTSIYWTYASGFPKAANISKLVDKRQGVERNKELKFLDAGIKGNNYGNVQQGRSWEYITDNNPVSKEAQELDGSYAGFQPKPAVEVILMVMKPLSEKSYVDQALANGKGVTWLDDCRIPSETTIEYKSRLNHNSNLNDDGWNKIGQEQELSQTNKRFPANLLVSDDVLNDGTVRKSGDLSPLHNFTSKKTENVYGEYVRNEKAFSGDSGSYSRFFDLDKWFNTTFPFLAVPKASSSEKNKGCENLRGVSRSESTNASGNMMPTESTPSHEIKGNFHPTCKPLKLMSWLVTLLSRPNDIVLDPFCGSGTTLLACEMLKRNWIGIELNKEYIEITNARLAANLI